MALREIHRTLHLEGQTFVECLQDSCGREERRVGLRRARSPAADRRVDGRSPAPTQVRPLAGRHPGRRPARRTASRHLHRERHRAEGHALRRVEAARGSSSGRRDREPDRAASRRRALTPSDARGCRGTAGYLCHEARLRYLRPVVVRPARVHRQSCDLHENELGVGDGARPTRWTGRSSAAADRRFEREAAFAGAAGSRDRHEPNIRRARRALWMLARSVCRRRAVVERRQRSRHRASAAAERSPTIHRRRVGRAARARGCP